MCHLERGSTIDLLPHLKHQLRFEELHMVFQPILSLSSGRIYAYEALLRSSDPGFCGPEAFVEAAVQEGCSGELGRWIRKLSVEGCPEFPLFINVHPEELQEGWLVRPDDPIFLHEYPVFLEITESAPFEQTSWCRGALDELRAKGVRLVVDDLGSGYSNLAYIADLAPDVVKLDRALIAGTRIATRRAELIASLADLCGNMGALLVAEGIETETELAVAQAGGVDLVQGYLLARPAVPPPVPNAVLSQMRPARLFRDDVKDSARAGRARSVVTGHGIVRA